MRFQGLLLAVATVFSTQDFAFSQVAFAPAVTSLGVQRLILDYPRAVAAADVNGDGWEDLIIADESANQVILWTNTGNGIFSNRRQLPIIFPASGPTCIAVADVNHDGRPDIIYTDEGAAELTVLTNNGIGNFAISQTLPTGIGPTWVIAVDINHDGSPDLISANWVITPSLSVFTNNGGGIFGSNATYKISSPDSVAAADLTGSGNLDLLTAGIDGTMTVLTNNGSGAFGIGASYSIGGYPRSILAVDVNGDGAPDAVTVNTASNTLSVWTNNGSGILGSNATYTVGSNPYWVVSTNLNDDRGPDLICANGDGTLSVLTNDGSGHFAVAASPHVGTASEAALAVADLNNDGHLDIISVNNHISGPGGGLSVLTAVPVLESVYSNSSLQLSWPSSWTNWTLQQNPDLTTTNWTNSTGTVNNGTNNETTVSASAGNLFFRLTHP